jgi:hypothetical protein
VTASLVFAGGCVLALAGLRLAPILAQRLAVGGLLGLGLAVLAHGGVLAGLVLLGMAYGLHAILTDIRRAEGAAPSPSCEAPGAPSGAGDAGERDGERNAPKLPVACPSTAGCAGRPRSFWRRAG